MQKTNDGRVLISPQGVNPAKNPVGQSGGGWTVGTNPNQPPPRRQPVMPQGNWVTPAAPAQAPPAPGGAGVLSTPGAGEVQFNNTSGDMNRRMNELDNKGYAEQLYESGNQGLNIHYDREHEKRQKRLADQMSAMGLFGSGATAKGLFELEAELGSQQARDMAGLASVADASRMSRSDQSRAWADSIFNQAKGTQNLFQDRNRLPLSDKYNLASSLSGIFSNFSDKSADEQGRIREDIIQTIIGQGGVDRQAAEQQAEEMFRMFGIGLQSGLSPRAPTPTPAPAGLRH